MNAQSQNNPSGRPTTRLAGGAVAGAILVMVGLLVLATQFADFNGFYFLPVLAGIFLFWALLTRTTGLLVPGGILSGISAGILLTENVVTASEPAKGGLFLLAFAGGWVLVSLLSLYTEGPRNWMAWPLIPGGIMATIGSLLLWGETGLTVLEYAGQGWPVVMIAIGLYLILRRKNPEE
ncbi:MAG TPA: hypothetical protein VFF68_06165 [Anaerolineaceae bacterium]|nr:hypothetical protein [Anaerolineaceae bacterium]